MFENLSHTHNCAGAFCREGGTNTSYSLCRSIGAMSQTTATGGAAKNGDASFTANCDYSEQKPRKRGASPEKHYCTDSLWISSRPAQSMCQTPPSTSTHYSSKKDLTRFRTQAYADECELLWLFSCAEVSSHFSMIVCANKFFHCMTFYCLSFVAYGDNLNYA